MLAPHGQYIVTSISSWLHNATPTSNGKINASIVINEDWYFPSEVAKQTKKCFAEFFN